MRISPEARSWPANMNALTLVGLALLPFGVLVVGTWLFGLMQGRFGAFSEELAIVYFIGLIVVALLLALMVTAIFFSHVGLASDRGAMGLPEGSIRAILALGLVLVFAVLAMALYGQVNQSGTTISSTGLTLTELQAVPQDQIVGQRSHADATGATVYDIDRKVPGGAPAEDIAKQLVTTLSTLVVAVAAFYFGANTAAAGRRTSGRGPLPDLGTGPTASPVPAPPAGQPVRDLVPTDIDTDPFAGLSERAASQGAAKHWSIEPSSGNARVEEVDEDAGDSELAPG